MLGVSGQAGQVGTNLPSKQLKGSHWLSKQSSDISKALLLAESSLTLIFGAIWSVLAKGLSRPVTLDIPHLRFLPLFQLSRKVKLPLESVGQRQRSFLKFPEVFTCPSFVLDGHKILMFDFVWFYDFCYIMDCQMLRTEVTRLHLLYWTLKGNKNSCTSGFKMPFNAGGEPQVHLMHFIYKKCF